VFFVRGLSFKGMEILINPDQVLYVHSVGLLNKRTALTMTHGKRLLVDQTAQIVRQRFEDYFTDLSKTHEEDDPGAHEHATSGEDPMRPSVRHHVNPKL
jgi:uncharacterized protein YlzI (FlbEa/FlbD family)